MKLKFFFKISIIRPFSKVLAYEIQQFVYQFEKLDLAFRQNMKLIRKTSSTRLKTIIAVLLCLVPAVTALPDWDDFRQHLNWRSFKITELGGKYSWDGKSMNLYERKNAASGYVELYTEREKSCNSDVFLAGVTLLDEPVLGIFLFILTIWLFVGLTVISNIMMEAVHEITAETDRQLVKDTTGKELVISVPSWNSNVAQVTILALAGALPEICFCYFSYFGEAADYGTGTPSELGPMVLVGSAAFNLLVICGLSIAAVNKETTIKRVGIFAVLAFFSTFAYLWLLLVVRYISPGSVQFSEAIFTLLFYPLMLLLVWLTHTCTRDSIPQEEIDAKNKRYLCKHLLIQLAGAKSPEYVINMASGSLPPDGTYDEMDRIRTYYKICLNQDDLRKVSLEELIDVLEPESVVDRLNVRKNVTVVGNITSKPFAKIDKSEFHCVIDAMNYAPVVFKSAKYAVSESSGSVCLTIEKKIQGDFTFRVQTHDDTATAPQDYEHFDQIMTMSAKEEERDIEIMIARDKIPELDEQFSVHIKEEDGTPFYGRNNSCVVTIIDDENEGNIGFIDTVIKGNPLNNSLKVTLQRQDGTAGVASVCVTTTLRSKLIERGMNLAKQTVDYSSLREHPVVFGDCQQEATFYVPLPDNSFKDERGFHMKSGEPVYFALELSDPRRCKLSKRSHCLVRIAPDEEAWKKYDQRMEILRYYLYIRNPNYFDQFRLACCLSPSIDEVGAVEDVAFSEAIMHYVALPWKILFAVVPPRRACGGWIPFVFSSVLVGCMVYLIMEVVRNMGCFLNITPVVQAVILIAICSSIPEVVTTYRSVSDGVVEDAAEIFNPILASNAVNVFVGLGLPWTIRTIYDWQNIDDNLSLGSQQSGDIAWISFTFLILSIIMLLCLGCRRLFCISELGGKFSACCTMFFLFLWVWFVVLNVANGYTSPGYELIEILESTQQLADINDPSEPMNRRLQSTSSCPPQMQAPSIISEKYIGDAYVSVDFKIPFSTVQEIDRVQVDVRFSGGAWRDISQHCSGSSGSAEDLSEGNCWVDHVQLRNLDTYQSCTGMQVRVRACYANDQCCGIANDNLWSLPSQQSVDIAGEPPAYELSIDGEPTFNEVTIQWDSQKMNTCGQKYWYNLEMKRLDSDYAPNDQLEQDLRDQNIKHNPFHDVITEQGWTQTSKTVTGLDECSSYYFRGRVITDLQGLYSNYLYVKTCCDDCNPAPVITRKRDCNLTIDWSRCFQCEGVNHNIEGATGEYEVQIQDEDGIYQPLDTKTCGGSFAGTNQCSFNMRELSYSPISLSQSGTPIIARVRPVVNTGEIQRFSQQTKGNLLYTGIPTAPKNLQISKQLASSAVLEWQSSSSQGVDYYQVWQKQEGDDQFSKYRSAVRGGTSLKMTGLVEGQRYQFYVTAVNGCYESEPSRTKDVTIETVTHPHTGPECHHGNCAAPSPKSCSVELTVKECDLEITLYGQKNYKDEEIEVQGYDYQFYNQGINCGPRSSELQVCEVDMSTLSKPPYFLRGGDLILVRARTLNTNGQWGPYSKTTSKSVATMRTPRKPVAPTFDKWVNEQSSAIILFEGRQNNDEEVTYNLYYTKWSQGRKVAEEVMVHSRNPYYQLDNIAHGYTYKFSVQVKHKCGVSQKSEEFCLHTPPLPGRVMLSSQCTRDCDASTINWAASTEQANTPGITWELDVIGNDGRYHPYPQCSDIDVLECKIEMRDLYDYPWNLVVDAPIKTQVKAIHRGMKSVPLNIKCGTVQRRPCDLNRPKARTPQFLAGGAVMITIYWEPCDTAQYGNGVKYQLEWDNGLGGSNFQEIGDKDGSFERRVEIMNVRPMYKFRVTAYSECGQGRRSSILRLPVFEIPEMPCPTVTMIGCKVHVSWTQPTNTLSFGGKVDEYRIQVKGRDNNWYKFDMKECKDRGENGDYDVVHSPSPNRCTIGMDQLEVGKYRLEYGRPIQVYVEAKNALGWSNIQETCQCNAYMESEPLKMSPPRVIEQNSRSISLEWSACSSANSNYILHSREGSSSQNAIQKSQGDLTQSFPIKEATVYSWRIECKNDCGSSLSDWLTIETPNVPQRPSCEVNYGPDCSVEVSWKDNTRETTEIQQYEVSLGKSGNEKQMKHCGVDPYEKRCSVKMSELKELGNNEGDEIMCRVSSQNKIAEGWSQWSISEPSNVLLRGKPPVPAQPKEEVAARTMTSVKICWDGSRRSGSGSQTTTYDLWGNDGVGTQTRDFKLIAKGEMHRQENCHTYRHGEISSSKDFDFYVEVTNDCGASRSRVHTIRLAGTPGCPKCVLARGECDVQLSWVAPDNDGGSPIKYYDVEVLSASGSFIPVTKACTKSPDSRKCVFSMDEFIGGPFNLNYGDPIKMRVVGVNEVGRGCESLPHTETFFVTKTPNQITGLMMNDRDKSSAQQLGFSWDRCDDGSTSPRCTYNLRVTKDGRTDGSVIKTTKTSYLKQLSHHDLGCEYNFCVSAANSCGESPPTCTKHLVCGRPDHPQPICHYEGCAVRIQWHAPTDHGCPINRYRLTINGKEHTDCTSVFQQDLSCNIRMDTLKSTYGAASGSAIAVTAEAKNKMGWSDISYGCDPQMFVFEGPNAIKAMTRKVNDHTIEVCAHPVQGYQRSSREVSYTYYWNEGDDNRRLADYTEVTTTPNKCYPVQISSSKQRSLYKFKVKASNACNYVEAVATQSMARCPDTPSCVMNLQASCSLLIKWGKTSANGSPITGYEIEIETASYGRFAVVQCAGRGGQYECEVSMDTLRAHPFNLRTSDDVNVRMKACNQVGCSQWSNSPLTRVQVQGKPPAMQRPKGTISRSVTTFSGKRPGMFTVCWQNMFFQNMEQTALLSNQGSFDLAWGTTSRQPGDSSAVSGMPYRKTTTMTCHKDTLDPSATMYRFAVRAINACGYGDWSEPEEIFVPENRCADPTKPCDNNNNNVGHEHDWQSSREIDLSNLKAQIQEPETVENLESVQRVRFQQSVQQEVPATEPQPFAPEPATFTPPQSLSPFARCRNPLHPSQPCIPCHGFERNISRPCSVNCKCPADVKVPPQHDSPVNRASRGRSATTGTFRRGRSGWQRTKPRHQHSEEYNRQQHVIHRPEPQYQYGGEQVLLGSVPGSPVNNDWRP